MNPSSPISHVYKQAGVINSSGAVSRDYAITGTFARATYTFYHEHPDSSGMSEESVAKMSLTELFAWAKWLTADLTAFKLIGPRVLEKLDSADKLLREGCARDEVLLKLVNQEFARRVRDVDSSDGMQQLQERRAIQEQLRVLQERLDKM